MSVVVVIESRKGWRWFADGNSEISVGHDVPYGEMADQLKLYASRAAADTVFLALASEHVQCAAFNVAQSKRTPDHAQLVFQFEHETSLVAERMSADFVLVDQSAFGAAVDVQRYQALVQSIEEVGLRVAGIAPAATLVAQQIRDDHPESVDVIKFTDEGSEVFFFADRLPTGWIHVNAKSVTASQCPAIMKQLLELRHNPPSILADDEDIDFVGPAQQIGNFDFEKTLSSSIQRIVHRKVEPWFDLRTGELQPAAQQNEVRSYLKFSAMAVATLFAALALAFYGKANQYEHQIRTLSERQRDIFSQVLPNQRIPTGGILSRLKSHARLMRNAQNQSLNVQRRASALDVLQSTLHSMQPIDAFAVRRLSINNGQLDLELAVPTFGHVNAVVAGLQKNGFQMSPPSSTQEDDSVVTQLLGIYVPKVPSRGDPP